MATNNDLSNTSLVTDMMTAALSNQIQKVSVVKRDLESRYQTASYGSTIDMRRPVYVASSTGAVVSAGQTSDVIQGTVPVTVDERHKVVLAFTGEELALDINSPRILDVINASAEELANVVEGVLAQKCTEEVWNYTDSTSGATLDAFANAEAYMCSQGVRATADKYGFVTPFTAQILSKEVSTAFSFPSVARVSEAMERSKVGTYSSIMFMKDQVLSSHTSGVGTGTILVNGNDQNVTYDSVKQSYAQDLVLDGATISTLIFKKGDVINVATFDGVNRKTRNSIGELQDYVVNSDATSDGSGNLTVNISPPLIAETGVDAAYNTLDPIVSDVTAMDGLAISVKTGQSNATRKENLIICPEAIQLAMVDLPSVNEAGANSSTRRVDGVSLRLVKQYVFDDDEIKYRCDVLFAAKVVQPYYAFRIGTSK